MEKINNVLDRVAAPLGGMADWLLRLGLGISFFLHGYGKMPIGAVSYTHLTLPTIYSV